MWARWKVNIAALIDPTSPPAYSIPWSRSSRQNAMANILLGVTGSVAAIRAPMLVTDLRSLGHNVKIVATHAALYFFDPADIKKGEDLEQALGHVAPLPAFPFSGSFFTDEAEWPGRNKGRLY